MIWKALAKAVQELGFPIHRHNSLAIQQELRKVADSTADIHHPLAQFGKNQASLPGKKAPSRQQPFQGMQLIFTLRLLEI